MTKKMLFQNTQHRLMHPKRVAAMGTTRYTHTHTKGFQQMTTTWLFFSTCWRWAVIFFQLVGHYGCDDGAVVNIENNKKVERKDLLLVDQRTLQKPSGGVSVLCCFAYSLKGIVSHARKISNFFFLVYSTTIWHGTSVWKILHRLTD